MNERGLIALAAILATAPISAQEVERVSGRSVAIYNIAGHVEIVPGSGSDVVVRIARHGDDADRLSIETGEIRGRETVRVVYPADQVVYPEMGRGSNTTQRVRDDGTFSDGGRGRGDQVRGVKGCVTAPLYDYEFDSMSSIHDFQPLHGLPNLELLL